MKPVIVFNDIASCTLSQPINTNDTEIHLSTGNGAQLPTIGTTSVLILTLVPAGTTQITDSTPYETLLITAKNGDILTVDQRGFGASTPRPWITGDLLINVDNAEYLNYIQNYVAEANKQIYVDSYNATHKIGDVKITSNNNQLPCWTLMSMAGRGFIGAGTYNGAAYVAGQNYGSNDAVVVEHKHIIAGYHNGDLQAPNDLDTLSIDSNTKTNYFTSGALDVTSGNSIGTSGTNKNLPAVKAMYIYQKTRDLTIDDLA